MRLVTLHTASGTRAGRLEGDRIVELDARSAGECLRMPDWRSRYAAGGGATHDLGTARLAAPVLDPTKIICLGLNYREHIREMGRDVPEFPTLFAKFADALIGPTDDITLPAASDRVDWEAELVVVIGANVRRAGEAEAREAIAGFTVMNDISMRDWQNRTTQWLQGKTFERCTPVGPAIVTPDEIDWARDLTVTCSVDAEVVQSASTREVVFGPIDTVCYVSQFTTLRPGDLIATGTPSGVGAARKPPRFLQPGNMVRTAIEGVGELVNRCVPETGN